MKKYYLIVANEGKNRGLPVGIKVDLFLIGTDPMCQIRSHLPGVASQHCAIVTRDFKVFIRDLDSDYDTIVNGSIMPAGEEWPLHASDRIKVGPLEFLVQFQEKPLSQRDLEEWALKCLDKISDQELTEGEEFIRREYDNAASAAASILDKLQAKRGIVKGRLRVGREGKITTIRFNDVYLVEEAEVQLAKKELFENAKPGLKVLLDCKNVRRMSSNAAEMLFEYYKKLQSLGCNMAICRVRPELMDILHVYHVLECVPHFAEKRAALTEPW